jgi:hypothetical protein
MRRGQHRNGPVSCRSLTEAEKAAFVANPAADIENRLVMDGTFFKSGLGVERRDRSDQPFLSGYAGPTIESHSFDPVFGQWTYTRIEGTAQ